MDLINKKQEITNMETSEQITEWWQITTQINIMTESFSEELIKNLLYETEAEWDERLINILNLN